MQHYTYILKSKNGSYYTGYTNDLVKRLNAHTVGKGAKFTRAFGVEALVACWCSSTKSAAQKLEWYIKQQRREYKESLVANPESLCQKCDLCEEFEYKVVDVE